MHGSSRESSNPELASLGAEAHSHPGDLASRARMVRRELVALCRLAVTPTACCKHDGACLEVVLAAASAPTRRVHLKLAQRRLRECVRARPVDHSSQALRDGVAGPVSDLEQPLARRAAAARKPVAAVLARELHAVVRISTSLRSAVSCELAHTSAACCSGESSSSNAAWMPPCAFAELHDCSASFVTRATRAPAASALTAAARPEAPEPTTSTSYARAAVTTIRV